MLQEKIRLPYPWIKIKNPTDELLYKLSMADDQEEAELFLFRLYAENEEDLNFFSPEDRERVQGFLRFLMTDTRRHQELMAEILEEIKGMAEVAHES